MAAFGYFELVSTSGSVLIELASSVANDAASSGVFFKLESVLTADTIFPSGSSGCSIATSDVDGMHYGDAFFLSYGKIGSDAINRLQFLRTRNSDNFIFDLSIWQPTREASAVACLHVPDNPYGPVYTFDAGDGWWDAGSVAPRIKKAFGAIVSTAASVTLTNPFTGSPVTFSQSNSPSIANRRSKGVGNQNLRFSFRSVAVSLGTHAPYGPNDLYSINNSGRICQCGTENRFGNIEGDSPGNSSAVIVERAGKNKLEKEGDFARYAHFYTYENASDDHVPGMPQLNNGVMFEIDEMQLTYADSLSSDPVKRPVLLDPSGMIKGQFKSQLISQTIDTGFTPYDTATAYSYEIASVQLFLGTEYISVTNSNYVVYYRFSSFQLQQYGQYDLEAMEANLQTVLQIMDGGGDQFGRYPWDFYPSSWEESAEITLQKVFPNGPSFLTNRPIIGSDGRVITSRRIYSRTQQVFGRLYHRVDTDYEAIEPSEFTEQEILASTATSYTKRNLILGNGISGAYARDEALPEFQVDVIRTDTAKITQYPLRRPVSTNPDLVIAYNSDGTAREVFYGYRFADGPMVSDGDSYVTQDQVIDASYEREQAINLNSPETFPAGSTIGLSLPT